VAKATTKGIARRLPVFRSDEEERQFWETHSPADYLAQMRPARVQVSKRFSDRVKSRKSRQSSQSFSLRLRGWAAPPPFETPVGGVGITPKMVPGIP